MKKIKYILIVASLLFITGCQNEKPPLEIDQYGNSIMTINPRQSSYVEKRAVKKVDACWYESMAMSYSLIDYELGVTVDNIDLTVPYDFLFMGYNICESSIKDADETKHYGDDKTYWNPLEKEYVDIDPIRDFLDEKSYNRKIKLEDLEGLQLHHIPKETIVELYNEAFDQQPKEKGDFYQHDTIVLWEYENEGVIVTVGALVNWGYIDAVNLQFEVTSGSQITLTAEQISEINISISEQLVKNQNDQVKSIPFSDDVITLELVNNALKSALIKNE